MTSTRRAAMSAGILFLVGTAAGLLSIAGAADSPDYLRLVAANEGDIIAGALFQCVTAAAYTGVGLVLHPVLKRHSPTAASGFLGFRIAAGVLNAAGALVLLLLLELSSRFVGAGAVDAAYFETMGGVLRVARDGVNHGVMMLALIAGDALYYGVLSRARLVPRWLSVWGFAGLALALLATILVLSRVVEVVAPLYASMMGVLGLQQLVFALWLIAKGLREETPESPPGGVAPSDRTRLRSCTG